MNLLCTIFTFTSRYYRSGMEMVRMATVYHAEGNLENAYILYFKFMTLFLEKILSHPEYKTTPAELKKSNQDKLKEVLPLTEKLKSKLLERYRTEYTQFLANKEAERVRREATEAREAAAAAQKTKSTPDPRSADPLAPPSSLQSTVLPSAPIADHSLDQVVYPNDFPSQPTNKSNLPAGLLLPDSKTPKFDRTLKPLGSADSLLEGNLRCVLVPSDIMAKFLSLASRNTANNVETCGILAGRLVCFYTDILCDNFYEYLFNSHTII